MDPREKMQNMLASLWEQHSGAIEERYQILSRAAAAFCEGRLAESERQDAHSAAHKLAGALGTFGREKGTQLARKLEGWFADPETLGAHREELDPVLVALKAEISSR